LAKEIANEMQDVSDCEVAAAMMKMASEQDTDEGEEETTDENETTDEKDEE